MHTIFNMLYPEMVHVFVRSDRYSKQIAVVFGIAQDECAIFLFSQEFLGKYVRHGPPIISNSIQVFQYVVILIVGLIFDSIRLFTRSGCIRLQTIHGCLKMVSFEHMFRQIFWQLFFLQPTCLLARTGLFLGFFSVAVAKVTSFIFCWTSSIFSLKSFSFSKFIPTLSFLKSICYSHEEKFFFWFTISIMQLYASIIHIKLNHHNYYYVHFFVIFLYVYVFAFFV